MGYRLKRILIKRNSLEISFANNVFPIYQIFKMIW